MSNPSLWLFLAAALLSCYFSAVNYALIDYSRGRLRELLEASGREARADRLSELRDDLLLMAGLIRAILNLAILLLAIDWFSPPDEVHRWTDLLLAFLVTGVAVSVFGVAIPVSWSRYAAEPLLAATFPVLKVCVTATRPLLWSLHLFDPIVRRVLGIPEPSPEDTTPLQQEILDAVSEVESAGEVDQSQKRMIEAVVDFPSTSVDKIMTPRTDIQAIDVTASLEDVKSFFANTGHSRVPVYENDIDHIVGLLYVKDLTELLGVPAGADFDLRKITREALFVPESKTLRDLLGTFKHSKVHMAIVLDEYGGTAGLITIEDIIEQIFGDIQDEYEQTEESPLVHHVDQHTLDVQGRIRLADLNDELPNPLPTDQDYDTLGGFVFATLGHIPVAGESFDHESMRFTVTEVDRTRVNTVRIQLPKTDSSAMSNRLSGPTDPV